MTTHPGTNGAKQSVCEILLIEDDEITRSRMSQLLSLHYQVQSAVSGEEALQRLNEHKFDLILLDLMLENMRGDAVLRAVRQEWTSTQLPVIITSGRTEPHSIVEGLKAGANDYITKPIDPAILLARIQIQLQLKQMSDERTRHIMELERVDQLRLQLTRIASHDLKNPLHNLNIARQLLREEFGDHNGIEPILDTLDSTFETMRHVVDSFLDVTTLPMHSSKIDSVNIKLKSVVRKVHAQYEISARKKGIKLHIGEVEGMICADEARMVQALGNLVSNAIKYSPAQTTVEIWAESHEQTHCICVSDQGPGIPEKERDELFVEFGTLSTRPTAGEPRTGLGLWIVQQLVTAQGGIVGADFPDDGGSIFWIEMPIGRETREMAESSS